MNSTNDRIPEEVRVQLKNLALTLEGDLLMDFPSRLMYATDASVYREIPLAVARPCNENDIRILIEFAGRTEIPLIPRGAGTSLAGQVVGSGLIVDISRYMHRIIEFNKRERWIKVQPGVVLDELNQFLEPQGLFFGPETSTSNRCMIGGMVANNSAGSHSLIYGTTRDHLLTVKALLSNGSSAEFQPMNKSGFEEKCRGNSLENSLYRNIRDILLDPVNQEHIRKEFPDPSVVRRNTGYAIDVLLNSEPFVIQDGNKENTRPFNFCTILAGSEGTLAFITEIKLNLVPLPSQEKALICVHVQSLLEAIRGNLIALKFRPDAIELMDKTIMDCTKENISQRKNRFFIQGDPAAILIIEFSGDSQDEILKKGEKMEKEFKNNNIGYHFPIIFGKDIAKVWDLRKAGLEVLSNVPGAAKPISFIEDTSVNVQVLENFVEDFQGILAKYNLSCAYYAHISVGEIHMKPILNLKDPEDVKKFRGIAEDMAKLVRKYKGSLSGEHGDGRARAEFIPLVIGDHNYSLLRDIKKTWDPDGIFNPGKIIDPLPMHINLRYQPGQKARDIPTIFSFDESGGILGMAEKCNGSGDCRKSVLFGGTMCPSFMATRNENTTTRARANLLREFLTQSKKKNPFNHSELYEILDLCLSCKGCKSECPSNVDMAKMKAEFLYQYYISNSIPLRTRLIAHISSVYRLGSCFPALYNFLITNKLISNIIKNFIGFARDRSFPRLFKTTLIKWCKNNLDSLNDKIPEKKGSLYLFVDEFTNYTDVETGLAAINLLSKLGYQIKITRNFLSGRTFLSKGFLKTARKIAVQNVAALREIISENQPLVGIEPSAILSFRDEYSDLVGEERKKDVIELSRNVFMIDEFLMREMESGNIRKIQFTNSTKKILLHGHCQQKALVSTKPTQYILSFPFNYKVDEIPSGCCGMAGSFGFEKEHYDLSMKIGEMVLFPSIRNASDDILVAAPGTSCRHHISDGTGKRVYHPVEILCNALI